MSSYFISNYESEKHEQLSLQEKRALCENVKGMLCLGWSDSFAHPSVTYAFALYYKPVYILS